MTRKKVAFADEITAAGRVDGLRKWWDELSTVGLSFGYFPKPSKSWLIVKPERYDEVVAMFNGTNIQISLEGSKHLGTVIGGENIKRTYLEEKVSTWVQELTLLSKIAITQPQAAYSCFTAGYQHKLTYFLRTISGCEEHLVPVDEVICHKFIPALTGGHVVNELECQLLALPPRLGGLGLKIFSQNAVEEYQNSTSVTVELQEQILGTIIDEE